MASQSHPHIAYCMADHLTPPELITLSRNVGSVDCMYIMYVIGATSYPTYPLTIPGVVSHKIKLLILPIGLFHFITKYPLLRSK